MRVLGEGAGGIPSGGQIVLEAILEHLFDNMLLCYQCGWPPQHFLLLPIFLCVLLSRNRANL
jgi:hypothetical protein